MTLRSVSTGKYLASDPASGYVLPPYVDLTAEPALLSRRSDLTFYLVRREWDT